LAGSPRWRATKLARQAISGHVLLLQRRHTYGRGSISSARKQLHRQRHSAQSSSSHASDQLAHQSYAGNDVYNQEAFLATQHKTKRLRQRRVRCGMGATRYSRAHLSKWRMYFWSMMMGIWQRPSKKFSSWRVIVVIA